MSAFEFGDNKIAFGDGPAPKPFRPEVGDAIVINDRRPSLCGMRGKVVAGYDPDSEMWGVKLEAYADVVWFYAGEMEHDPPT